MKKKKCTICKHRKIITDFNIKRTSSDGRQPACRECNKKRSNAYYAANREKHKKNVKVYKKKYKEELHRWLINYFLEHPCIDCGESDIRCLEFDHVRGKKSRDVSILLRNICGLSTIQKEIKKCDVRCANCHRKKTAVDFDWYKNIKTGSVA